MRIVASLMFLLLCLACATTGMQKKEKEAPLVTEIAAAKDTVYQITATKLMEYGFEIESSDPVLGRISTGYVDLKPGLMEGAMAKVILGEKDFKASLTTQITEIDSISCRLVMHGTGQYAEEKGIFRADEIKHQPVRQGTFVYKRMQEISTAIKDEAEK